MTPNETEELVDRIKTLLKEERKIFWIDAEQHYNDHVSLHEMVAEWKSIKGTFFKMFLGLVIIGSIALAGLGTVIKLFR